MTYTVSEPITMAVASEALVAGNAAIEAGQSEFSLSNLTGSDSSALAVLLAWQRRATRQSRSLRFVDVPSEIVQFAMLYGIQAFLPGFPDSPLPTLQGQPVSPRASSPADNSHRH
ncbi:MAG: STAS domain-containing protein [Burkholderiaceae bacterium]